MQSALNMISVIKEGNGRFSIDNVAATQCDYVGWPDKEKTFYFIRHDFR